jgi:hypothetical protein
MNTPTPSEEFINSNQRIKNLCDRFKTTPYNPSVIKTLNIIKIDDEYKVVETELSQSQLMCLLIYVYPNSDVVIYTLPLYDYTKTKSYLQIKNSFLENHNITDISDALVFCENFVKSAQLNAYFDFCFGLKSSYNNVDSNVKVFKSSDYNGDVESIDFLNPSLEVVDEYDPTGNVYSSFNDNLVPVSTSYDTYADIESNLFKTKYYIYFNSRTNSIMTFQFQINHITSLFPELVEIYSGTISDDEYTMIEGLCKEIYVDAEDARKSINKIINDKVIDSKLSLMELKTIIKKYFTIDSNPENRIKFTNIWEIIGKGITISSQYNSYYRHILPTVLEDLGLSKKRYSDGVYWYGLQEKKKQTEFVNNTISSTPLTDDEYKEKISKRDDATTVIKDTFEKKRLDSALKKIVNV